MEEEKIIINLPSFDSEDWVHNPRLKLCSKVEVLLWKLYYYQLFMPEINK